MLTGDRVALIDLNEGISCRAQQTKGIAPNESPHGQAVKNARCGAMVLRLTSVNWMMCVEVTVHPCLKLTYEKSDSSSDQ